MPVQPSRPPVLLRTLPPHPDLDQLKRQAKELLAAFSAGDAEATADVHRHHHGAAHTSLQLSDAQLVIARAYGFESWPKLKAHVDGVTFKRLREAVLTGDVPAVRSMLRRRPELVNNEADDDGERRLIHWALLNNDPAMVRELMRFGADARIGIWPHRDCTTAYLMAQERGLEAIIHVIEEQEAERREAKSCPNITISPEQERLHTAIRAHRDEEAIALLEAQPDLARQCDRDGATALHAACSAANVPIVEWLCDHRADARRLDSAGRSPMDHAVNSLNWRQQERREPTRRILHRLLARGCTLTPLGAAALGDIEALRRMHRQAPARLTEGYHWLSGGLLTAAVRFGQIEAVRCLLEFGLDPDEPIRLADAGNEAWSWGGPLWHAAAFGELEIARLLLDRGADPSANVFASGWPLDRAYERGDRAMIDLLYARGARPSAYTVCNAHDLEAAQHMLENEGHDPDLVRELVWSAASCTSLPIMQLALPRLQLPRDDPRWHDLLRQPMRPGDPPAAVRPSEYRDEWRYTIQKMMLDHGADPNIRGQFGLTLLHFAATSGRSRGGAPADDRARFAELLLDAGADPHVRDELLQSSALGWAARYGQVEIVRLLLQRGVSPVEPDAPAWASPLEWARKTRHHDIQQLLLSHGAGR
jgi:ankyrin repeat protein